MIPAGAPPRGGGAIDRLQLRALLRAYFLLSVRARGMAPGARQRTGWRTFGWVGFGYAMAGAAMGIVAFGRPDVFSYATLVHAGTLLVGLSVTGVVAGDVLFGSAEAEVIGFRPVTASTLLLAKALNLAAVAALVAVIYDFAPALLGLQAEGARPWFPVVHLVSSVLLGVFAAAAQVFLYALLARFVPRERLERAAAFLQVAVSIGMILAWQIVPRMAERAAAFHFEDALPWLALAPPAWFAGLDAALAGARPTPAMFALAAAGCAATLVLGATAVGRLAPRLEESMTRPPAAAAPVRRPRGAPRAGRERAWPAPLAAWVRDPVERGAFRLALAYLRRDRELWMRLYPSLAPALAMLLLSAFQSASYASAYLPVAVVMFAILPATTLELLELSSQPAAAEVFRAAPLVSAAGLFHGVRKAVLAAVVLPYGLVLAVVGALLLPGRTAGLAATIPLLLVMPLIELAPAMRGTWLPLSRDPQRGVQAGRSAGTVMVSFALLLPVMGLGWAAQRFGFLPALLAGEAALVVVARVLMLRHIRAHDRIEPAE